MRDGAREVKIMFKIQSKRKIETLLLAVCFSATLIPVPAAIAGDKPALSAPPLERYTCYQVYAPTLTYTYMGYFVLQPEKKYVWGFGKAKPDDKEWSP